MVQQIQVSAGLFRAVAIVQSTEETRYYLNGVHVAAHPDGGVLLVATDGHRLVVAHDADGVCTKSAIIQLPKNAIPVTATRGIDPPRLVIDSDGFASLGDIFKSPKSTFIDGTFPDWPRVLRPVLEGAKKKVFAPASFNAAYLAEFGKVAAALSVDKGTSMRVISFSEGDPALILFPRTDNVFGVLMPMRAEIGNALPAFMRPIMEPTKPAEAKKPAKKAVAAKTRKAA